MKKEPSASKEIKAGDAPAEEEPKPVEEAPRKENMVVMKKGDYSVHVLIEEIKGCIAIKDDSLPFPVVKVTCLGKSQRTEKTDIACTDYPFEEHFYYDKTNLTAEMWDSEKILIEAYDHKHTSKSDYFGIYEFDFEYIYNRPDHALNNFWLALANPWAKEITQVRGYLKWSISVLHENDPRIELEIKEGNATDCLVPSQIKMEFKQWRIEIFKAEKIPDMDEDFLSKEKKVNGRCNGYVEVKYLGITKNTKIVEMKNDIINWNQSVNIPVSVPAVSQKIVMIVKDKDTLKDDIVGSIEIKMDDVLNGTKYTNLSFVDIYGSSVNKSGGIYDKMNYNSEIGSKWKGRLWVKIKVEDTDTPEWNVTEIEDKAYLDTVYQAGRKVHWNIYISLYGVYYLPNEKEYGFRISTQDSSKTFAVKKATNNQIEWDVSEKMIINTFETNPKELPDIFLYLTDKNRNENFAFQRLPLSELCMNTDIMVIKLLPEFCVGKIKEMMNSGIVKARICCVNKQLNPQFDESSFLKAAPAKEQDDDGDLEDEFKEDKPKGKVLNLKKYTVKTVIYMSKELIAADSTGTSDPFVVITHKKTEQKTKTIFGTANGIWNEIKEFNDVEMDISEPSTWPIFLLQVIDYNPIKKNVLMGYNYLWLCDSSYTINSSELVLPQWKHLWLPKSNKKQGQILLSFYIFDEEHLNLKDQIKFKPETTPYTCEINVLGLRQLKPLSLVPVKKAFIKFDMNSLNVTGEDPLQPVFTIPTDSGKNPTINTVFKFDVRLPKNEVFIPELQCEVYDHLLNGMINSLLGIFTINVKRIISKTHAQIDEDMKFTKRKFGLFLAGNLFKKNMSYLPKPEEEKNIPKLEEENIQTDTQEEQKVPENNVIDTKPMLLPKPQEKKKGKGLKDPLLDSEQSEDIVIKVNENEINTDVHNDSNAELAIQKEENLIDDPVGLQSVELSKEFIEKNKENSAFYVLYPKLKKFSLAGYDPTKQKEFLIEDEAGAPDSSYYFKIGYILKADKNMKPEDASKHYRRIYREPLEGCKALGLKSPFIRSKLKRGKFEDVKNENFIFDAMRDINGKIIKRFPVNQSGEVVNQQQGNKSGDSSLRSSNASEMGFMGKNADENNKNFGKFKGVIRISEKSKLEEYEKKIKELREKNDSVSKDFKNLTRYDTLRQKILTKKEVIIRVYILEMNNLAKKDLLSESDPYIKMYINDKEIINEKKNHQDDQKNCKWYKYYDIPGELPGSATLKIDVWDYDDLLPDDLIGETVIDLEDRYFDEKWQALEQKPIEVRPLLHPDLSGSQGELYLWVEILAAETRSQIPVWSIAPEPITHLEARFVVWETEDMELMDVEGTSDIYVIGYIDMKNKESTDVHFRCQTGTGSFNWRMLLPISAPISQNKITIDVYDNDLFSSDDYICGGSIDIKNWVSIPKLCELPIKFDKKYFDSLSPEEKNTKFKDIEFLPKADDSEGIKFWVQCYKQNKKGGRVMCSLEILPKSIADLKKVGRGRDEPNLDPYLPPPVGRFEWSLNPFKMLNQCVGPKFRRKMYCGICLCLLGVYLICIIPYCIMNITGTIANPFTWFK